MIDSVELNPGSGGEQVASDNISGIQYQAVKVMLGAEGSTDGFVNSGNPMPVQLSSPSAIDVNVISGISNIGVSIIATSLTIPIDIQSCSATLPVSIVAPVPLGVSIVAPVPLDIQTNKYVSVTTNFTRPADTNGYSSGDYISNSTSSPSVLTFTNCARANGLGGIIRGALLVDESGASNSTSDSFALFLFDTTPTAGNDNAAYALSDSEARTLQTIVFFPGTQVNSAGVDSAYTFGGTSTSNCVHVSHTRDYAYQCAGGSTSLYGLLIACAANNAGNAARYDIRLNLERD